ncbi:MAG: PQQ-binding-like beta-propeller repeat protein [Planctomycetota bacterium]
MNLCLRMAFACVLAILLSVAIDARAAEDWAMWRSDASRSAATSNSIPDELQLIWKRDFGARKQAWDDPLNLDLMTYDRVFEPIVMDGRMFLGFNDSDKLVAMDTASGKLLWKFFAEAPIRVPPVGWQGKVFVCSDDGFLYCVDAKTGGLVWKFRGGPNSQHALGNQRLTSAWPARGGPVIYDQTVYFAASIWPFMGTFIYAIDAATGEVKWVNDNTGSQYIKQPHSAPSFAGVAPQGAFVATEDWLIVPGGRSVPAVFNRHDGSLKYFEFNAGGKGTGGSFVSADDLHFYVHTREKGTRAFDLTSGTKTSFTPNEPVHRDGLLYSAETEGNKHFLRAYDVSDAKLNARKPIWQVEACGSGDLILAGGKLVAAGEGKISVINVSDVASSKPTETDEAELAFSLAANANIARLLVADHKLFAVTTEGEILAFGNRDSFADTSSNHNTVSAEAIEVDAHDVENVSKLLAAGDPQGYAFWYGNADNPTLMALARNSPFEQLAVIDSDSQRISRFRNRLDSEGLYGRVTGHVSSPVDFRAPKYVGHMVFVGPDVWSTLSGKDLSTIYQSVRPYGGSLWLMGDAELAFEKIRFQGLEQLRAAFDPLGLIVRREGALPGAADWTHQYGDVANSIKSNDSRVKLPLGILWFGGSSNMDVLPRHGHGPPQQVVGGRLFIEGMNCLSARDVYTGRVLWKREFERLGTFDVYFDSTYENTPLNPKYNQVHIPGANGRGTNYVVTKDRIYLLEGGVCRVLDPATGKDLDQIELPKDEDGDLPEWGYLGVYKDVLIGGLGFAKYRERYDLPFESDKDLRSSRAGFGSKSFDRAASRAIVGFDRHTGELLWQVDANHSFWHNGIVAGGGKIYCLDKNPKPVEDAMRRRGLAMPDSYRIISVDFKTGEALWEVKEGIFGTWLGYSEKHDMLLQAGARASDRLSAEVGKGMRVYQAGNGKLQWKNDSLNYAGPCILHNDLILTNANSYAESAGAFYLESGKQKMVKNPLTGEVQPWKMTRAYGCNNIIASENLLTFRSGAAGYYDLLTDSGTGNLGGFKSGCTSNLVVANGVLNAPDYTRTCSCSYQNQTSLALVHMPDVEIWSVNALAANADLESEIKDVGINFGAPGDRRDPEGTLWLEFPVIAGDSPPVSIEYNADAQIVRRHSSSLRSAQADLDDVRSATSNNDGTIYPWVAASMLTNVKELKIGVKLTKGFSLETGLPVSDPNDDAEENAKGDVALGSSDLELVDDGGDQVIGVRFTDIQLMPGAKIKKAYVQFTCDEVGSDPTSLMIAGELVEDSAAFESTSHDISSRTRTQNEMAWQPPAWRKSGESGKAQRTPDLSSILQEIVDQPGWELGNALSFLINGSGKRTAVASRGPSEKSARLVVIADQVISEQSKKYLPTKKYDIELLFGMPQEHDKKINVFDVLAQGKLVASDVTLSRDADGRSAGSKKIIRDVEIANELKLEFVPKQGQAILSGVRIQLAP